MNEFKRTPFGEGVMNELVRWDPPLDACREGTTFAARQSTGLLVPKGRTEIFFSTENGGVSVAGSGGYR